jgi:prolipoprotein diacylglyceryltransferase
MWVFLAAALWFVLLWLPQRATERAVAAMALCGAPALVLGRLAYVALNSAYFSAHPADVLRLAEVPGLAAAGLLPGFAVGAWLALRRGTAWTVVFGPALFCMAAALQCVEAGCMAGREVFWTDGVWWLMAVDWPDALGVRNPRLPAQLFLAGAALISGFALVQLKTRPEAGVFAAIAGVCLARLITAPALETVAGSWAERLFDGAILCAALALTVVTWRAVMRVR